MDMRKRGMFLLLIILLIAIPSVFALDLGLRELGYNYSLNYQLVDFFIYLLIFGFIFRKSLERRFGQTSGIMAVAFGIGFSLSLIYWENSIGQSFFMYIGNWGWLIGMVLAFAILARIFGGFNIKKGPALVIAIVVVLFVLLVLRFGISMDLVAWLIGIGIVILALFILSRIFKLFWR